ncbi:MAG: cytochrome ubiquinol oxidase subunit I [Cellulomonadaceae bacterium]|nr:cytochrome ubiquinol oxidase subunit I [Cellulomonadaceae bacterium]
MDVLDLARWQFGITTVYHFIFVPLTIGLTLLVAIMQTLWVVSKHDRWLTLTKFYGKLMMINFAIGVVTGIVQEFQFGMTWSEYSRFVGDVFGAPLAMEALLAFFVESVFLGLWVFGWSKLSRKVHLACIWLVAAASGISASFILAANSWMQHPVGTTFNPETGRAEMASIGAVLTNPTLLAALPHTLTAAWVTAGGFVMGVALWWMVRTVRTREPDQVERARDIWRPAVILGAVVLLVGAGGVAISGDTLGQMMVEQQPGKMAAAEAVCDTEESAAFTVAAFGTSCENMTRIIEVPYVASFLSTHHMTGPRSEFKGTNDIQAEMEQFFADNTQGHDEAVANHVASDVNFIPDIMTSFWSFRLMIGLGLVGALLALLSLWVTRKGRLTDSVWMKRLGIIFLPLPFLACSFGWIFTEIGRQPWLVHPAPNGIDGVWLLTERGVSSGVSAGQVLTSMIIFTLVYAVLAVAWYRLMHRYTVEGLPEIHDDSPDARVEAGEPAEYEGPLTFAY